MANRIPQNFSLQDLKGRNFASVSEASAILRVDPQTVRSEIAKGRIPCTRIGRDYRIPVSWLAQQVFNTSGGAA